MTTGDAQYQRKRLEAKRKQENQELIPCLECDLSFIRIGSHVVQVHNYTSAAQYRKAHGLTSKEMTTKAYKEKMAALAKNSENLEFGAHQRFKKGGDHGQRVKEFWQRRKAKEI